MAENADEIMSKDDEVVEQPVETVQEPESVSAAVEEAEPA